jgi:LysM repeat protein
VQHGETLWSISDLFHVDIQDIRSWNGLSENDPIRAGQLLTIFSPDGVAAPTDRPELSSQTRTNARTEPTEADSRQYHRVEAGETLSSIALHNAVSVDALCAENGLKPGDLLHEGAKLKLPARTTTSAREQNNVHHVVKYTVKKGDTVWAIADTFGVPIDRLYAENGLTKDKKLMPGDTIKIVLEEKL